MIIQNNLSISILFSSHLIVNLLFLQVYNITYCLYTEHLQYIYNTIWTHTTKKYL